MVTIPEQTHTYDINVDIPKSIDDIGLTWRILLPRSSLMVMYNVDIGLKAIIVNIVEKVSDNMAVYRRFLDGEVVQAVINKNWRLDLLCSVTQY